MILKRESGHGRKAEIEGRVARHHIIIAPAAMVKLRPDWWAWTRSATCCLAIRCRTTTAASPSRGAVPAAFKDTESETARNLSAYDSNAKKQVESLASQLREEKDLRAMATRRSSARCASRTSRWKSG